LGILAPNNIGYEIVKGFEFGKTRSLAKLGYEILSLSPLARLGYPRTVGIMLANRIHKVIDRNDATSNLRIGSSPGYNTFMPGSQTS